MDKKIFSDNFKLKLPIKDGEWWDGRPKEYSNLKKWGIGFSQRFGGNFEIYKQFGLIGHNGIDIAGHEGTPIVAPCRIYINMTITNNAGYGYQVWAESEQKVIEGKKVKLELVFGHFRNIICKEYKWNEEGDILGFMDSTGFSTGNHLHFGIRPIFFNENSKQWEQVLWGNGYCGYIDPEPLLPHIVWDFKEIYNEQKIMENLIKKNEKKIIIEGEGIGRKGIIINGKLRIINKDREAAACLYVLTNNGLGQFVSSKYFNEIKEDKNF